MYILPVCDIPHLEAVLTPHWQLPGGRHSDQHHLFPVDLPVRPRTGRMSMLFQPGLVGDWDGQACSGSVEP